MGNQFKQRDEFLKRLRVEALSRTLYIVVPVGAVTAAAGIGEAIRRGELPSALLYALLYGSLLVALFGARPDSLWRPILLVTPVYVLALSEMWDGGTTGLADMVLLVFVVFTGAFLGPRAGAAGLALSVLTMVAFATAFATGLIPADNPMREYSASIFAWIAFIPTYLLFSSGLLVLLGLMMRNLENSAQAAKRTAETLISVLF